MATVPKLQRVRAGILRVLAERDAQPWGALERALNPPGLTLTHALAALLASGQITRRGATYTLTPAGRTTVTWRARRCP